MDLNSLLREDRLPNISFCIPNTKTEAYDIACHTLRYQNQTIFYTDGSVKDERAAWGIHATYTCGSQDIGGRLQDLTSIFVAEMEALLTSMELALKSYIDGPIAV